MGATRAGFDIELRRSVLFVEMGVGIVALMASAFMAYSALRADAFTLALDVWGPTLVGAALAAVGTRFLVAAAWRLRHPLPGLIIDTHGITDATRTTRSQFMPWDAIEWFELKKGNKRTFLFACRTPPASARGLLLALGDGVRRQAIAHERLDIDVDALFAILQRHLAMHQRHP